MASPSTSAAAWMGLSSRAMEGVCSGPRQLDSFFHHVPCAPETFFHTVLGNTKGLRSGAT